MERNYKIITQCITRGSQSFTLHDYTGKKRDKKIDKVGIVTLYDTINSEYIAVAVWDLGKDNTWCLAKIVPLIGNSFINSEQTRYRRIDRAMLEANPIYFNVFIEDCANSFF